MIIKIILAISGLIFSAFFAGAESAYTRFNKVRLEIWTRRKIPLAKNASYFLRHPDRFFSTILIGNNLANTLSTTFATVVLMRYMDEKIVFVIIGFIILLIGEIIPKTLMQSLADRIILQVLLLVRFVYFLLAPLIRMINRSIELLLKYLKIRHESFETFFSREEIEMLINEQNQTGTVPADQFEYIGKVLQFASVQVREVMSPRTEMTALDIRSGSDKILDAVRKSNDAFVVVHRGDMDDIAGVIFFYDLFEKNINPQQIVKKLNIVPENKTCVDTFNEFQKNNISVALVVDEYGGTAGLVTMDDLVEELLGEFLESSEVPPLIRRLNKNTWLADAHIDIEDLCQVTDIDIPEGDYETPAGFILKSTGKIPNVNEIIKFDTFRIKIIQATRNKIEKIQIVRLRV